jgi:prepilin-type N-terminal cleavage/methylation domain-containing protein
MKRVSGVGCRVGGFTLIEVLVAVLILTMAFTIIWTTFSVSLSGWRRGQVALDRIHHGDFVMEQVVSALRSAAHFSTRPDKYGFWLEDHGENDEVSWVTSGSAFMKPEDPLARGLHRIWIGIKDNRDGEPSFAVRAYPHFAKDMEPDDVDPLIISSRVKGLDCKIWNNETEDWDNEWENTNTVPPLVQVTLFLEPMERGGPAVEVTRMVEIPVGPSTTGAVSRAATPGAEGTNTTGGAGSTNTTQKTTSRQPAGIGAGGVERVEKAP